MGLPVHVLRVYYIRCQNDMSYINEALKKAQKEKEARYHKYHGIASEAGHKHRFFPGKALWWAFFCLIPFAVTAYLLLFHRGTEPHNRQPTGFEAIPLPERPGAAALCEKAIVLHKSGNLQEAKRLYEETLCQYPDHVEALNNLGVIHIHDNNYSSARASFAKAIRFRPDYVDACYNLACLHALEGDVIEGLVYLKKAVSLDKSVKDWARMDSDLQNLRGEPEFEEMTESHGVME